MAVKDVKDAIRMAKEYVINLFDEEQIRDVGLEEVKLNHDTNTWEITIGFARPWEQGGSQQYPFDEVGNPARSYKAIHIGRETGRIKSLKDRFLVDYILANRK